MMADADADAMVVSGGVEGRVGAQGRTDVQGVTEVQGDAGAQRVTDGQDQSGVKGPTGVQGDTGVHGVQQHVAASVAAGSDATAAPLPCVDLPATSSTEHASAPAFTAVNDASALVAGEVVSSPAQRGAEVQRSAELKRPLSPSSAVSGGSQESKRMKESHANECLHCGSSSHRWTTCMNDCEHCGHRHMGKRCMALAISKYMPSELKPNEQHRPKGHPPALKLTLVPGVTEGYALTKDSVESARDASEQTAGHGAMPRWSAAAGLPFGTMGIYTTQRDLRSFPGDEERDSPMQGTEAFRPDARGDAAMAAPPLPSMKRVTDVEKTNDASMAPATTVLAEVPMDPDRAAMMSTFPVSPIRPDPNNAPVKMVFAGGPRSSGANDMPLGQRKQKASISGPQPVAIKVEDQEPRQTPFSFNYKNGLRQTTPAMTDTGRVLRSSVRSQNAPAPPAVPPYGQTLFSSNDVGNATTQQQPPVAESVARTAARPKALAAPPKGRTAASTTASTADHTANHSAASNEEDVLDKAVWKLLEAQIKTAVTQSYRPGKMYNGTGKRGRVNLKVNEALGILKPIILGCDQPPSSVDFESAAQDAASAGVAPASVAAGGAAESTGAASNGAAPTPGLAPARVASGGVAGGVAPVGAASLVGAGPAGVASQMPMGGFYPMPPPPTPGPPAIASPMGGLPMGAPQMPPQPAPPNPHGSMVLVWNWMTGSYQWVWQ